MRSAVHVPRGSGIQDATDNQPHFRKVGVLRQEKLGTQKADYGTTRENSGNSPMKLGKPIKPIYEDMIEIIEIKNSMNVIMNA